MKRKLVMLLFVLTCTITISAQQAVYKYFPRIAMGSTVEQVKQKMKSLSQYRFSSDYISDYGRYVLKYYRYIKDGGSYYVDLVFDDSGKLMMMKTDKVFPKFKLIEIRDQLNKELEAAGKKDYKCYAEDSFGEIHLLEMSKTNGALFIFPSSTDRPILAIISTEGKKEYILK